MKLFLTLTILIVALTTKASAQTPSPTPSTCPTIYGGGLVCKDAKDFSLNKTVQHPQNGRYVDRIPDDETKIAPERTMIFRIEVTNKTTEALKNIQVTDTLPSYLEFVRADSSVKNNKQVITYTINTIEPEKTAKVNIEAKVVPADKLPSDTSCVANQVEAKTGFGTTNQAKDFVTFCIAKDGASQPPQPASSQPSQPESKGGVSTQSPLSPKPTQPSMTKGGLPVYPAPKTSEVPNTGPELLALIGLIPAGIGGVLLRRVPYGTRLRKKTKI